MSDRFKLEIRKKNIDELLYSAIAREYGDELLYVNKFSRTASLSANVEEDVWEAGGILVWQTSGSTLSVVGGVNDTALGTGARMVTVKGLDENYNYISETITLTGTTPAISTNEFMFVYRAFIVSAGSLTFNDADIVISYSGTADTATVIIAGQGQSQMSHFIVPAGYTGLLLKESLSVYRSGGGSGSKRAEVELTMLTENMVKRHLDKRGVSTEAGVQDIQYRLPAAFPEKTRGKVAATAETSSTIVSVQYSLLLIKDTQFINNTTNYI